MTHPRVYEDGLRYVMENGRRKTDRTGTGTRSVFGMQMRFPLHKYFPAVTTKKLFWKGVKVENCWFLRGDTNIKYLVDRGVHIWDEWADEGGELGPVYGSQWRAWECQPLTSFVADMTDAELALDYEEERYEPELGFIRTFRPVVDQITTVFTSLRDNPDSRRHIVSAWNPAQVDQMALPPCHALFQFYVEELTLQERAQIVDDLDEINTAKYREANPEAMVSSGSILPFLSNDPEAAHARLDQLNAPRRRLSCQLYQRSADMFLGVPFNIAGYSLLTHMFAHQLGYAVGDFVWTGGDCHVYENHIEQVELQLSRETLEPPQLKINRKPASLFEYEPEDFDLVNYQHHPAISAPVAV